MVWLWMLVSVLGVVVGLAAGLGVGLTRGNDDYAAETDLGNTDISRLDDRLLPRGITRYRHSNIWRPPMDNTLAPALAAKSLDLQTREVFNTLVSTILFPATYAAFYRRVDQDIIAYVRDDQRAQCAVMNWMVRCYASWYFGKLHSDQDKMEESRYIYGVLLQYFRQMMIGDDRRRTAEITFTIAILLGIYEVLDGQDSSGWLVHMRGVKELLRLRGANAFLTGFGRTIMLACRGFFVGEAFVSGEECILAGQEWVNMNARAFEREERAGRGSKLVTVVDQAYREIVRAPGLVARARAIAGEESDGDDRNEAEAELRPQIRRSRANLRRLTRRLACVSGMDVTVTSEPTTPRENVSGLYLDPGYVTLIARYNLRGVCAVESLLGQALMKLNERKHNRGEGAINRLGITSSLVRHDFEVGGRFKEDGYPDSINIGSLDDLFLSMGAMTIDMNA
ncbi:uncharacterized protein BDV14DRAFT_191153 [Aspergillus stella-maris]|uniref:uncharacterized protein n=1 Tax=Aspergillus stella-maris TaxID=1810926 RepID=UPI003CCD4B63